MEKAIQSAITGLNAHRSMIDAIGDNIANSGTNGYKGAGIQFVDVLAKATSEGSEGNGDEGVLMTTDFTQGAIEQTDREFDFALSGDGFFVVHNSDEFLYTRAGSMSLNNEGNLVTSTGSLVQGYVADAEGTIDTVRPLEPINIPIGSLTNAVATTDVELFGNLPASASVDDVFETGSMIYFNDGTAETLSTVFTKTAAGEWTVTASVGEGDDLVDLTLTDNVITFDELGDMTAPEDLSIKVSEGQLENSELATITLGNGVESVSQYGSIESLAVSSQDGVPPGALRSVMVSNEGLIVGSYSNGTKRNIAQFAVANFVNSEGLERVGGTSYRATVNSGEASVLVAGSEGRGVISSGALETSNVDLAAEFVDLIAAQRGFQAASRLVSTLDELMSDVVNLKR